MEALAAKAGVTPEKVLDPTSFGEFGVRKTDTRRKQQKSKKEADKILKELDKAAKRAQQKKPAPQKKATLKDVKDAKKFFDQAKQAQVADDCVMMRDKILEYHQAFPEKLGRPPKIAASTSYEEYQAMLASIRSRLNRSGSLQGFITMLGGFFQIAEAASHNFPQAGVDLTGLPQVYQESLPELRPTIQEFVIEHGEYLQVGVNGRLAAQLLQLMVMVHKMNTDPAFAANLKAGNEDPRYDDL